MDATTTLTGERADLLYKCTTYYAPAHDRTIRWDDPDLAIDWRTCGWQDEDRLLYLEFRRYPWQGTGDRAIPAARRAFAERRDHAAAEPLDIGEEAYADPLGDTRLAIEARQANVVVTVRYYAEDDAGPLTTAERTELARLAATAVARVS
jgi:hypothetical protein